MTNAGGWDQAEANRVLIASFVKLTRLERKMHHIKS